MKVTVFLVLSEDGSVKLTKTAPNLNSKQVAVKLSINISDKFFKRFIPETELAIPDEYVLEPKIEARIKDMSKQQLEELQRTVTVELERHKEPGDETKAQAGGDHGQL